MSRLSSDDFDESGILRNGFDYDRQIWVVDYICQNVGMGSDEFAGQDMRELENK